MTDNLNLVVKWNSKEYDVGPLLGEETVGNLKDIIFHKTGVRPERQKLLNLKFKGRHTIKIKSMLKSQFLKNYVNCLLFLLGKMPENDCKVSDLQLKSGFKIMMMGSLEEAIADANKIPDDLPEVIDDFDIEEGEEVAIENKEVYLAKIERRVKEYQVYPLLTLHLLFLFCFAS